MLLDFIVSVTVLDGGGHQLVTTGSQHERSSACTEQNGIQRCSVWQEIIDIDGQKVSDSMYQSSAIRYRRVSDICWSYSVG